MSFDALSISLGKDAGEVVNSDEKCLQLAAEAEAIARYAAQNLDQRVDIALELGKDGLWDRLGGLWPSISSSFHPTTGSAIASEDSRVSLALALAKLERNLVAGLEEHQAQARSHEPAIRTLVFHLTSFARIEDPKFSTLQAVITQLLSNIVSPITSDAESTNSDSALQTYLSGKREDDVVIRLLDSQDVKTNLATLHLISNLARNDIERQTACLCKAGAGWFSKILGRMDEWHEKEDGRFDLAVGIFTSFIESGLHARLLQMLADDTEPITPSQTALLKLIDSHLASTGRRNKTPSPHVFLVDLFRSQVRYCSVSLASGTDDARLPKVFEGLVLVCEGLSSISLAAQSRKDKGKARATEVEIGGDEEVVATMKGDEGIIASAVDLLRQLDKLIPRVKPGSTPIHKLSSDQTAPVTLLKRLLVQLLGILTFEDTTTGDKVRESGGVELVLGLTEVDESNPYLREHALLTVRNLMWNNPANQAVVTQMDPIGVVSETGEVLPLPEKMRRNQAANNEAGP